jgi:hypothetical protein
VRKLVKKIFLALDNKMCWKYRLHSGGSYTKRKHFKELKNVIGHQIYTNGDNRKQIKARGKT